MAPKRVSFNRRMLVWSLLSFCAAGALVHLLHSIQWKRNSAALLAMADAAETHGDRERSLRFLGQYVVRMPTDTETMARFGFMLNEPGQSLAARRRARRVFEEVLIRDNDRADVRRQRLRASAPSRALGTRCGAHGA